MIGTIIAIGAGVAVFTGIGAGIDVYKRQASGGISVSSHRKNLSRSSLPLPGIQNSGRRLI